MQLKSEAADAASSCSTWVAAGAVCWQFLARMLPPRTITVGLEVHVTSRQTRRRNILSAFKKSHCLGEELNEKDAGEKAADRNECRSRSLREVMKSRQVATAVIS